LQFLWVNRQIRDAELPSFARLFLPQPGVTPEEMLAEIIRHSRFTIEEFQALATEQPIDVPGLHRRIRGMIEDVESFIARLPSDAVGVIFMEGERAVQPDVNALDKYQRNPGAPSCFWLTSPEISRAMLERNGNWSKVWSSKSQLAHNGEI